MTYSSMMNNTSRCDSVSSFNRIYGQSPGEEYAKLQLYEPRAS
jgi:hypothetical protein